MSKLFIVFKISEAHVVQEDTREVVLLQHVMVLVFLCCLLFSLCFLVAQVDHWHANEANRLDPSLQCMLLDLLFVERTE